MLGLCGTLFLAYTQSTRRRLATNAAGVGRRRPHPASTPTTNLSGSTEGLATASNGALRHANLDSIKRRVLASVSGALWADAATAPLHWIYDQSTIAAAVEGQASPLFHDPPACPFYTHPVGSASVYGDELQPLIADLAASPVPLSQPALWSRSEAYFRQYTSRLNHIASGFIEQVDAGKSYDEAVVDSQDANGFIKVPFVVARFIGVEEPTLLAKLDAAVSSMQRGNRTLAASRLFARVLSAVLTKGMSTQNALEDLLSSSSLPVAEAKLATAALTIVAMKADSSQTALNAIAKESGLSCKLPASLVVALGIAATFGPKYKQAVATNLLAGGDNCGRSFLVGALSAAEAANHLESEWEPPSVGSSALSYKDWAQELVAANPHLSPGIV